MHVLGFYWLELRFDSPLWLESIRHGAVHVLTGFASKVGMSLG